MKLDRSASRGFTFIETMIVLVIIGIVATFAVLMIGGYTGRPSLSDTIKLLQLRINAAKLQAVLRPTLVGIFFNKQGFSCKIYKRQADGNTLWQPLPNDLISLTTAFQGYGNNLPNHYPKIPQIQLNPNGFATPFQLILKEGNKPTIIVLDRVAQVHSQAPSNH